MTAAKPAVVDAGAQRIFHLTHLRNLPGILAEGRILSDAAGARPAVDISAAGTRTRRRGVMAAGRPIAEFVPFFLVPNASLWVGLRSQEPDPRLAEDVRGLPAAEFVLLVSSVRAAGDGTLVADDDAADPATRFRPLAESGGRMPLPGPSAEGGFAERDEVDDVLGSAEFLVPGEFAFSAVSLIGVANDRVRAEVRALLGPAGFTQKVSVYPPWFERA